MTTPRVFIIRHGETEWSLNGRHTGSTDIPLTPIGERRIIATGRALVGDDRLIVPRNLAHVYVSPRRRAQRTLELLGLGCCEKFPWQERRDHGEEDVRTNANVDVTKDICEWDYGEYEGITSAQIRELRGKEGKDPWDIWREGCPGGESPREVTERVDRLIAEIRSRYHGPVMARSDGDAGPGDVLIVAHGHILRAFAMRWVNKPLEDGPTLILEVGGVGILSYEHKTIHEPAILLGGSFMADAVEEPPKKS